VRIGPKIVDGAGPAAVHRQIHEAAVGKTIEAVYLGEIKLDEPYESGGNDCTEFLLLEFTDGSSLPLQVASGNSFFVGYDTGRAPT
jgi:hypothetical protein